MAVTLVFLCFLVAILRTLKSNEIISNEELKERGISHVYMMGDIHGSIDSLLQASRAVGICDEAAKWRKRDVILVQVGDLIHRGSDSVAVVSTLKQWQQEAPQYNSQVIVLKGNHEFVQAKYYENTYYQELFAEHMQHQSYQFGDASKNDTYRYFLPDTELGQWIRQLPVIQVVGHSLFVHAGISYDWLSTLNYNITEINHYAATSCVSPWSEKDAAILRMMMSRHFGSARVHQHIQTMWRALSVLNYGSMGFDIRRVVIGHNPTKSWQIEAYYDRTGKYSLLLLDTGYVCGNWSVAWIAVQAAAEEVHCIDCHSNTQAMSYAESEEIRGDALIRKTTAGRKRKRADQR